MRLDRFILFLLILSLLGFFVWTPFMLIYWLNRPSDISMGFWTNPNNFLVFTIMLCIIGILYRFVRWLQGNHSPNLTQSLYQRHQRVPSYDTAGLQAVVVTPHPPVSSIWNDEEEIVTAKPMRREEIEEVQVQDLRQEEPYWESEHRRQEELLEEQRRQAAEALRAEEWSQMDRMRHEQEELQRREEIRHFQEEFRRLDAPNPLEGHVYDNHLKPEW